jgi:hypothetical protein
LGRFSLSDADILIAGFHLEKFRTLISKRKLMGIHSFCHGESDKKSQLFKEGLTMKKLVKMNRLVALTLAFVMAVYALAPVGIAAATKAKAAPKQGALVPVVFNSAAGSFAGIFNITNFVVQNGQLVATGTLTGTVRDAAGAILGTINQALTLPVSLVGSTGTCEILDLQLGPLDLNLLGLVVHLDQINLVITAESGPGNLLGNLLCAVAGLLDGGSVLDLAGLLNRILRILG